MIPIGYIVGIFGLHGELKVDPTTSGFPLFTEDAHFQAQLQSGEEIQITLAQVRPHKGRLLVFLEGVVGATEAQRYVGASILVPRERVVKHLGEDEILDADLKTCFIYDPEGRQLGSVIDVDHYPTYSMLVIPPGRRLVPFVKAFIREIDIPGRRIVMDLPEGLLEGMPEISEE